MEFEWDEAKRLLNFQKHGIDFADAEILFSQEVIIFEDNRYEYGEIRFRALGTIESLVVSAVFTMRGEKVRVISIRPANKKERKRYAQTQK